MAAVAAVFLLPPVFELTDGDGWAGAAGLAYPLCDLVLTGFAVVLWGTGRWRFDTWLALAVGFALIAVGDSFYVVAQAGDGWAPGSTRRSAATPPDRSCSPSRRGARGRRRRDTLGERTRGAADRVHRDGVRARLL